MSTKKLPVMRATELIRALESLGFERKKKTRGGHLRYDHPDGRRTYVPMHKGKTLGRGLLSKILDDVGINAQELKEHL